MNGHIEYRVSTYNGLDRKTGTEPTSYAPTLADAIEWSKTNEKFTFVLDLLELGLVSDGDAYCTEQIEAVEDAYTTLLDKRDSCLQLLEQVIDDVTLTRTDTN